MTKNTILKTELLNGRPEEESDRQAREIRTYDFLEKEKIRFERIDHEAVTTMEGCAQINQVLGVHMCKNLFLCNHQKTDFYLLLMPGDKKLRTAELSRQAGSSRLSFADGADMVKYLDIEPGSLSVMGLINDTANKVKLLIDEDLFRDEYIGCHPCVCTTSMKILFSDILEKFLPATGHEYQKVILSRN